MLGNGCNLEMLAAALQTESAPNPVSLTADGKEAGATAFAVSFTPQECPKNVAEATDLFLRFGDIAKIDISRMMSGIVFVAFFDARSGQRLQAEFKNKVKELPPAKIYFRAVTVPSEVLANLSDTFCGFEGFGDISAVNVSGADLVVEFFDCRAAQRVVIEVPGTLPRHEGLPQCEEPEPFQSWACPVQGSSKVLWPGSDVEVPAIADEQEFAGLMSLHGIWPGSPAKEMQESWNSNSWQSVVGDVSTPTEGHRFSDQWQVQSGYSDGLHAPPAKPAGGKQVLNKVKNQDYSKFDILPDNISSGKDMRTTVMVRRIPKTCTAKTFIETCIPHTLRDRYTFFYMPFDKRHNHHTGCAFINFETPSDVLKMYKHIQRIPAVKTGSNRRPSSSLAVSYASLQGHEALTQHFSHSAVMLSDDYGKRPFFSYQDVGAQGKAPGPSETSGFESQLLSDLPCYVSIPKDINVPDQDVHSKFPLDANYILQHSSAIGC